MGLEHLPENPGDYFEKFRKWLNFYSENAGIDFKIDERSSYPAYASTDFESGDVTICVNPRILRQKYKFSDEQLLFVIFHEVEHLYEDASLKSTEEGRKLAEELRSKPKEIHLLYNLFRDIYVNMKVKAKVHVLTDAINQCYSKHLFAESDYLHMQELDESGLPTGKTYSLPKHLQFAYAIFREAMLPEEECIVDEDVRSKITELKKLGLIKKAITEDKNIPGETYRRLMTIKNFIEPMYIEFMEKDASNKQVQEGTSNTQNNSSGNSTDNSEDSDNLDNSENSNSSSGSDNAHDSENSDNSDNSDSSNTSNNSNNSNNSSGDIYDDVIPHILEENISGENYEKIYENISISSEKPKIKSKEELELEKRLEIMGYESNDKDIIERLRKYDKYYNRLLDIKNPQTGESVIDEIYKTFESIKSRRQKPKYMSKGPVDMETGTRLDPGYLAHGIAQIKSGETNPLMFQKDIRKPKEDFHVGNFELTIVADGSGSMQGRKNIEQKKSVLLIFEAIKQLHDKLYFERGNLRQQIDFSTEGIMFDGNIKCFKSKSTDFTDKDRIEAYDILDNCYGYNTNDYDALSSILSDLESSPNEYLEKIKSGKTKKIVLVLTDGYSGRESEMKKYISKLREYGVLVYGIGITEGGRAVVNLFRGENSSLGFGQVCPRAEDLSNTLKELLIEHLNKL